MAKNVINLWSRMLITLFQTLKTKIVLCVIHKLISSHELQLFPGNRASFERLKSDLNKINVVGPNDINN